MKLLVKYYDVWGRPVQMFINVSSKGKISDLKKILSQNTDIAYDQLEVTLVVDENQFQLIEDDLFLSEYPFTAKAIVYVGKTSDDFSMDLDNQILQDKESLEQFIPPDLSIESITLRKSLISNFTNEENEIPYTNNEFQSNVLTMIDALREDQIELCKLIFQKHNAKLRQIVEETKSQEQREQIAKEFDIINDVETTGWSLLHLAAFNGKDKFLIWLIGEGGDPSKRSKDEWDCLKLAVWQCQYEVLMLLVAQPNININDLSRHGTALHLAAQLDDIRSVKILLKHPKINIFVINQKKQRPVDVAGKNTALILQEEAKIVSQSFRMNNDSQRKLLSMFTQSVTSLIELTNLSQNVIQNLLLFILSFMVNLPQRPPIIKGEILKVNYFKICHYRRFVLLDPESGVLARFKRVEDCPMKPDHLISLETVIDIRISRGLWFQDEDLYYIEISYINERIYIALRHKGAARQWFEALRNAVGYIKYVNGKVQSYISQDWKKAQKNVVQVMLQKANQEILIKDDASELDQKMHIKQQQIEKRKKYKNELQSVSEHSLGEESGHQGILESNTCPTNNPDVSRQLKVTDFEVLDYLGKGSFGNVYKVIFRQNQKIYALKQQSKQRMIKLNQLTYVKRELNILKQLHHPYLVHLHFAFQTNQFLYLALDFCGRGDLSKYMTRGVILNEITAKFIIAEIILAIEYLHEKNIIYRDLKPENIIVDDEGFIKLIDFGLSKEGQTRDIIAQSFCGSPAYLSPELIAGLGSTKATDIYSIGTILYEMLTGYPPFYCNDLKTLLQNIRYQKLNIPSNLSRGAQNILSKMLEKNPDHRIGGNNISTLKKHIFFADIDWEKLLLKKYIAPNLSPRPYHQSRALRDLEQYKGQLNIDPDDHCDKFNEISGWNYGF